MHACKRYDPATISFLWFFTFWILYELIKNLIPLPEHHFTFTIADNLRRKKRGSRKHGQYTDPLKN